jgi:hypothetical protein
MILKLIKYTNNPEIEDYIYLAADKIYIMEEIFTIDKKTESFKFSHTAIDIGFDEYVVKVRNPAEEICKMIRRKK